jgi:hypothetical protein
MLQIIWERKYKDMDLVGKPYRVSPGAQLPPAGNRREAICTHTPSSKGARQRRSTSLAQRRTFATQPFRYAAKRHEKRKTIKCHHYITRYYHYEQIFFNIQFS